MLFQFHINVLKGFKGFLFSFIQLNLLSTYYIYRYYIISGYLYSKHHTLSSLEISTSLDNIWEINSCWLIMNITEYKILFSYMLYHLAFGTTLLHYLFFRLQLKCHFSGMFTYSSFLLLINITTQYMFPLLVTSGHSLCYFSDTLFFIACIPNLMPSYLPVCLLIIYFAH